MKDLANTNLYKKYMKKCIALAKKSEGHVSPNPLVGALVFDRDGELCGWGRHEFFGEAHAEVNALKMAGNRAKGGTLVVNLEPCSHYGKTPPCADLIIKNGIVRVVSGMCDPNPVVSGNGFKKLKDAGIDVITGVLEDECRELNEIFCKNQEQKGIFVAIKSAITMDGKIATKIGSSKWITSEKARFSVQRLRNKYDAILTGANTVQIDNPSLTTHMRNGRNPIRVVIDSMLKTSPTSKVYIDNGVEVYIAVSENIERSLCKKYGNNVKFVFCPQNPENGKIDLKYLMSELYKRNIYSILVEAGGLLCGQLIKDKLVDKIYLYQAPKFIGDPDAISWISGFCVNNINDACKFSLRRVKLLKPDVLLEVYPEND